MWGFVLPPQLPTSLKPKEVLYVKVCSFTFAFHSLAQLEGCLEYYRQRIRPTSRIPEVQLGGSDHWECQRWFERLPMYLLEEPKRKRVVAALQLALKQWKRDPIVVR